MERNKDTLIVFNIELLLIRLHFKIKCESLTTEACISKCAQIVPQPMNVY